MKNTKVFVRQPPNYGWKPSITPLHTNVVKSSLFTKSLISPQFSTHFMQKFYSTSKLPRLVKIEPKPSREWDSIDEFFGRERVTAQTILELVPKK